MAASGRTGGDAEMARARAGLYGLLARVFGVKPTAELVGAMKDRQMLESLETFGVSFEEDFLTGDDSGQASRLAEEYTRLFTGPGPHIAAYESVYARGGDEPEPRLWGRATVEVAEFYREIGLKTPDGRTPDHLSLELEAMAVMAGARAERLENGDPAGAGRLDELEQRFCREHLRRWVPAVCREVEREARSSFYRRMAALTAGLVELTCGGEESGDVQEEEALNEDT